MTLLVYSTYDIINNIVKRLGRKNHIPHTSIPNTSSKIVITSTNNNTEGNFLKTSSTKNDTEGNSKTSATKERRGHQQQLESVDDNNDRYKDGKYSGGNQISDDDLFKRPPPPEDCPICLLPLPH